MKKRGAAASRKRPEICTEVCRSPRETERLGRRLARDLPVPAVVLLCGALGSGKTTLTRGIAQGLGLANPDAVHSPSFTLVNIYRGRCPIYHVDLYRVAGRRELESVGLEDFLGRDGVTIVEWGERLGDFENPSLVVNLEDSGGETRTLRIRRGR